jgi:hypothetical protein
MRWVPLCLEARLLQPPYGDQAAEPLRQYTDVRIKLSKIDLAKVDERKPDAKKSATLGKSATDRLSVG